MSLTADQYIADFICLYNLVMEVHPKPDFRVTKSRLEAEKDYALSRMSTCRNNYDFSQISQRFLNVVGDLQTRIDMDIVIGDMVQAPVLTELIDGKVVVDEVVASDEPSVAEAASYLSRGDELLFIDGQEVERQLQERLSVTSYNSSTWGRGQAAKGLLLYPRNGQDGEKIDVSLTVAKPDGSVLTIKCPLLPVRHPAFMTRNRDAYRRSYTNLVEGEFIDDGLIARLKFRGFQDRHMVEVNGNDLGPWLTVEDIPYMDDLLWEFFREARERGTKRLIIDVRNAQGGSFPCMDMPLKYLTNRPLAKHHIWAKVTQTLREEWGGFFGAMEDGIHSLSFSSNEYPYYSGLSVERLEAITPFNGDVTMLVNDNLYGGIWLATNVWANDLATFIGEPARVAAEPGSIVGHKLPNTGLWLAMSCMFFERPAPDRWQADAILPHRYVRQTLDDYRKGRDTIMEAALVICRDNLGLA